MVIQDAIIILVMHMKYEIGARIRAFRERAGLTQVEFANLIHVSNARVSNWELGLNRPDVDTVPIICSVLGIRADELLDLPTQAQSFSHAETDLINKYRTLDDHGKTLVDTLLDMEYARCINPPQPDLAE